MSWLLPINCVTVCNDVHPIVQVYNIDEFYRIYNKTRDDQRWYIWGDNEWVKITNIDIDTIDENNVLTVVGDPRDLYANDLVDMMDYYEHFRNLDNQDNIRRTRFISINNNLNAIECDEKTLFIKSNLSSANFIDILHDTFRRNNKDTIDRYTDIILSYIDTISARDLYSINKRTSRIDRLIRHTKLPVNPILTTKDPVMHYPKHSSTKFIERHCYECGENMAYNQDIYYYDGPYIEEYVYNYDILNSVVHGVNDFHTIDRYRRLRHVYNDECRSYFMCEKCLTKRCNSVYTVVDKLNDKTSTDRQLNKQGWDSCGLCREYLVIKRVSDYFNRDLRCIECYNLEKYFLDKKNYRKSILANKHPFITITNVRKSEDILRETRLLFRNQDPGGGGGPLSWGFLKCFCNEDAQLTRLLAYHLDYKYFMFQYSKMIICNLYCTEKLLNYYYGLDKGERSNGYKTKKNAYSDWSCYKHEWIQTKRKYRTQYYLLNSSKTHIYTKMTCHHIDYDYSRDDSDTGIALPFKVYKIITSKPYNVGIGDFVLSSA